MPSEFTDGLRVAVEGSGPFAIGEFVQFLVRNGVDAIRLDDPDETDADEVLVLGRADWSSDLLAWLIEARSGHRLRVYSQEMFLAYAVAGSDPFESSIDVLESFRSGHPGLEGLPAPFPQFDWPSTAVSGDGGPAAEELYLSPLPFSPAVGLLAAAGYRVGVTGVRVPTDRWAVLQRVMQADLLTSTWARNVELDEPHLTGYLLEWGRPDSAKRLRRIAESIAAFCRNERRRNWAGRLDVAIQDRETDLMWLKIAFYTGRFGKSVDWWPSTDP